MCKKTTQTNKTLSELNVPHYNIPSCNTDLLLSSWVIILLSRFYPANLAPRNVLCFLSSLCHPCLYFLLLLIISKLFIMSKSLLPQYTSSLSNILYHPRATFAHKSSYKKMIVNTISSKTSAHVVCTQVDIYAFG